MMLARWAAAGLILAAAASARVRAQGARTTLSPTVQKVVAIDTNVVALTHVRVIDGTGAPARADQTVIVRDGRIEQIGAAAAVAVPSGARVLDLTGKSVIPGLVMVHEHLFYPTGPGVYGNVAESFVRLYLAGGVTSMRTGGNMNGYGDIGLARAIARGEKPGPWIDATAPYLEGPGLGLDQIHELTGPDDARRMVDFWADAGATSFKAYMHITRAELGAAIAEAHRRGLKVTGHLCSVTYREAASLGIDNLEHGFFVSTDFVPNKQPDVCPGQNTGLATIATLTPDSARVRDLIKFLVDHHVAITSTLTVFETFTPGRPMPRGLDVLDPILREQFEQRYAATQRDTTRRFDAIFAHARALEVAFMRAGGLLLSGTDPTGGGGVVPGFSNQRELELLVESGLTPLEAIKVGTLNGATYLGRAKDVGSIAQGKQADLVVIDGDPSTNIADIEHVEMVFRDGIGYDPQKLIASVKGKVGLF